MLSLVLLVASSVAAAAELNPTAPGPGDIFVAGSPCTIQWNSDTSGKWTNVSIFLMSGPNDNMTRLTTVASGLDGTDGTLSPYNWTCPSVQPYSAIYFYQFTNGDDLQGSKWTTRFTITSPSGDSEQPEYASQPNGDAVSWGDGHLAPTDGKTTGTHNSDPASTTSLHHANKAADPQRSTDNSGESTSKTHRHLKSTTTAAQIDTSNSSGSMPTTLSTHSAPRSSDRPPSTDDSDLANASIPTAGLPAEKMQPTRTRMRSSSSPSGSAAPSSRMGPGVPEMGGMQLASSGHVHRDSLWFKAASLYPLVVAMLL